MIWVAFNRTSDGIRYSGDDGSSWVTHAVNPAWNGWGNLHGHSPTRIVADVSELIGAGQYYPIAVWNGTLWTVDTTVIVADAPVDPWCSEDEIFFVVAGSTTDRTWRRKADATWSVLDTLPAGWLYYQCDGCSNSAVAACGQKFIGGNHFVKLWDGSTVTEIYTSSVAGWPGGLFVLSPSSIWYAWTRTADNNIIIEYWNGSTWVVQHDANYADGGGVSSATAMHFVDASNGWLAGDSFGQPGPILHFDGTTWVQQATPLSLLQNDSIYHIHGPSSSVVYATSISGAQGRLMLYDGSAWSDITPAPWALLDPAGIYAAANPPVVTPVDPENGDSGVSAETAINFTLTSEGAIATPWTVEIDRGAGYELALTYGDSATFEPQFQGASSSITILANGFDITIEARSPFMHGQTVRVRVTAQDSYGQEVELA